MSGVRTDEREPRPICFCTVHCPCLEMPCHAMPCRERAANHPSIHSSIDPCIYSPFLANESK